jgi:hypothetical protein
MHNRNGDTTPVVIEILFHYRRRWLVLNENDVMTLVVIEIWYHYPRDGPIHNDNGTVIRPYFVDDTRRGKQSEIRDK